MSLHFQVPERPCRELATRAEYALVLCVLCIALGFFAGVLTVLAASEPAPWAIQEIEQCQNNR